LEAHKISSRAAKVGFDWPEIEGLFDKLAEEVAELKEEIQRVGPAKKSSLPLSAGATGERTPEELSSRLEDELGDLFFVLVNLARHLSLDSESALKKTNRKFRRRFQWMESQVAASNRTLQECSAEELEQLWQEAKRHERRPE
jgi:uncharacterized protein YabN with tetrapyrrole methylase and pyrophosphatase domain